MVRVGRCGVGVVSFFFERRVIDCGEGWEEECEGRREERVWLGWF